MRIAEFLTADVIKVGLRSTGKEQVINEMIDILVRTGKITDREAALKAIMEREVKQSTGIGRGVAIPHGKSPTITKLTGALGISQDGIEYDSLDGEPVQIVFMLLAEANNPGPHIEALAQVARLFQIPGFIEKLTRCQTVQEVLDVIAAGEEHE
jgi:PTS system nitrogen regulatory IIA component